MSQPFRNTGSQGINILINIEGGKDENKISFAKEP